MVVALVIHGLEKSGTGGRKGEGGPAFAIYCSQFFTAVGRSQDTVAREQAIAEAAAGHFRSRCLSSSYTQSREQPPELLTSPKVSAVAKPEAMHLAAPSSLAPSLAHLTSNVGEEGTGRAERRMEQAMGEEAVRRRGMLVQEEGLARIAPSHLFPASSLHPHGYHLLWKQYQRVAFSLVLEAHEQPDVVLASVRMLSRVLREHMRNNTLFLNPEEMLTRPEEVRLLVQMLLPNGNVLLASSAYLRYSKKHLDAALAAK